MAFHFALFGYFCSLSDRFDYVTSGEIILANYGIAFRFGTT